MYNLTFSDLSGIWQKRMFCVFNRLYYCRCLMCFDGGVYNLTFSVLRLCRLVRGVQPHIFCSLEKGVYNLTFSDLSGIWQKRMFCVFNRLYYCRCLMCFDGGVYNLTFFDHRVNGVQPHIFFVQIIPSGNHRCTASHFQVYNLTFFSSFLFVLSHETKSDKYNLLTYINGSGFFHSILS